MLLSSPPANPPGRISQLLPTVKCSNCNQPVPLTDLGDHICSKPPPVPTLPKPSVSSAAVASLLPRRLQGRLAPSHESHSPQELSQQRLGTPPIDRLKINTTPSLPSTSQQRPSPLSRVEPNGNSLSPVGGSRFGSPSPGNSTSPLRTRPPISGDIRARTASNADTVPVNEISLPTPRPFFSSSGDPQLPPSLQPSSRDLNLSFSTRPPPPRDPVPYPNERRPSLGGQYTPHTMAEREIDTKTGGEAGMAGVGRRGFAAAARAAMFVSPTDRPSPQHTRHDNALRYLNTDIPARLNETPPLSAGSGYSSHSPGVSPYPHSPVTLRYPSSPERSKLSSQSSNEASLVTGPPKVGLPTSPISPRMPFFEKFRNLPGVTIPDAMTPLPTNNTDGTNTPSTATQTPRARESAVESSPSTYSISLPSRSASTSTSASRSNLQDDERPLSPPMSESGSDYGGLAYADSTDYEDEDVNDGVKTKGKTNPPPPLPLTTSILRSGSIASTNHIRFPSTSDRSERSGILIPTSRSGHQRQDSTSSLSSMSSTGGESRKSNSAVIAHALGLSRTPPSSYGRLGGPGISMGGRGGRNSGSSGSRSAYSGSSGRLTGGVGLGTMEKQMKTLLDDVNAAAPVDEQPRVGLSKSKSTGKRRSFGIHGSGDAAAGTAGSSKTQRSNTVQGIPLTEPRSPKLPTRARTSTERGAEPGREKREKFKKSRVCLKCYRKIEDGRWVQVDNGGVLCENCWKNMYLPKCRRCSLPIEKQAVSSADGQLKGKYHRECFNCHICQKPFPDKSFYVFDGKPLCAYHYHEANDSLCAAAHCGQPIEGPCAVSHTGIRYHPEHMTCEYPGSPPCKARLNEYWEVDGRMLCERHAQGSDDEDEEEWVQSSRALKRVTRFIDLTGMGSPGAGAESELR